MWISNNDFFQRLKYHQFDAMNDQDYAKLSDELPNAKTTIFYLSTAPDLFHIIAELHNAGLLTRILE